MTKTTEQHHINHGYTMKYIIAIMLLMLVGCDRINSVDNQAEYHTLKLCNTTRAQSFVYTIGTKTDTIAYSDFSNDRDMWLVGHGTDTVMFEFPDFNRCEIVGNYKLEQLADYKWSRYGWSQYFADVMPTVDVNGEAYPTYLMLLNDGSQWSFIYDGVQAVCDTETPISECLEDPARRIN